MSDNPSHAIIIGAGIVGLSTALYLQRTGQSVTVIDSLPPAGGTSYGNSGLISSNTVVPIAQPGMLRKVPGWLLNSEGPLVIRPKYAIRLLPWLLRWRAAGTISEVLKISDAMRMLMKESLVRWRELLGDANFSDLIRQSGQVRVWEGGGMESAIERKLADRHGVHVKPLDAKELRDLFPGLSSDIRQGLLVPGNAHTVNPQRLVQTLARLFLEAGGQIIAERVLKIIPNESGLGYMLLTNISNRHAMQVVVATGAWSRELLSPLGIHVPLESERGYHAMLPDPSIELIMPISIKNRGFGMTPMEHGLRVTGTVEFAGLSAPPNEHRAKILVQHAKRIFPALRTGEPKYWMGHRPSTPDGLPVLGEAPNRKGLFLAFGHGHFGMTGGPPSAKLLCELMTGQPTSIDPIPFSCTRF
ncbi:NAD(P)/FAD-dependent oxidoreductase [Paraburkholderia tropica]|nr:FAD-binding oxidoreductase [Paraburkholderia tropica]